MNPYRVLSGFVLALVFSFAAHAQQTLPKTLLWRISGKGLQKPSYLYGTMHLTDKRIFRFGDSVYNAIEKSEGLAIEVNPDEMAAYMVNQAIDQAENTKRLEAILKEKDFKKYSDQLSKKFKKPASDITTRDIVKEKNRWMNEYMEKGEMPTFVDAYLYNIARRQGKWLGGIEDMADQAGLLEDLVDKSDIDNILADGGGAEGSSSSRDAATNRAMEKMIALYTSQDLEGIEAMTNGTSTAEEKDRMLITRNVKMARRIDSLSQLRTMFLAIGAAHLPGDSGVIYLLRKRGFTVEPVFSSRKIEQKDYTVKEVHLPWFTVEDSQGLYQASMPGNPASVKVYGVVEMKFLLDIFNMSGYCTMAVVSPADYSGKDSAYNAMAAQMMQVAKAPAAKIIHLNGIEGREYIQEKKGANIRAQIFLHNKIAMYAFIYGMKPAALQSEEADKFFASIKLHAATTPNATSYVFRDTIMGVRCVLPAALSYNQKFSNTTAEGWKVSAFTGADLVSGSYCMLFSKEVKGGHYIGTDSIVYKDFKQNLAKQYTDIVTTNKQLGGKHYMQLSARNITQPGLYITAINMIQHGRNLVLMIITDSAHRHSPEIEQAFASFQLMPAPPLAWQTHEQAGIFSCRLPAPLHAYNTTTNAQQFYAYDTSSSVSYFIVPDTLSKYYYASTDSAYWKQLTTNNTGVDSLVQVGPVVNGDARGIELLTMEKINGSRYKRMRLLQHGDKLYKLFASAEKDFLYSQPTDSFFTAFRFQQPAVDAHFVTRSKTALLLQDLGSADSATRRGAYNNLDDYAFTASDGPALQQALFRSYLSPYDTGISSTVNNSLIRKLAALKLDSTVDFVQAAYGSFTEKKEERQNMGLALLSQLHTAHSYTTLAALLAHPPAAATDYLFTGGLADSLALTASIYPVLQQLAADTLHANMVAETANRLQDSGFLQLAQVRPAENSFIQAARQLLPALVKADPQDYKVYELVKLLGRFNDAPANVMLVKWLGVQSLWLRKRVALQLLDNKQPVAAAVFAPMAADKGMRNTLYTDLKDKGKQALFPAKYINQASFAEATMYDIASDDEEPASMVFLQTATARYKNNSYVFYLYKIQMNSEEEGSVHLGIAGGYKTLGKGLEPAVSISGIHWAEEYDAKKINAQLRAYIAAWEKEEDKPEEE